MTKKRYTSTCLSCRYMNCKDHCTCRCHTDLVPLSKEEEQEDKVEKLEDRIRKLEEDYYTHDL